jgi:crossover junction endodeoxyribonuclease RuvC
MYVLGIDPGLSVTGYGIVGLSGSQMGAVAVGVIRTDPGTPVAARLTELHRDLRGLITEFGPTTVAVERVFVNRNLQTAEGVGRASGVILLAAAQSGLEVHEYTPSEIKLAVAGNGTAGKAQVQAIVARRLGLAEPPAPADAADALAVAMCHLQAVPLRQAIEEAGR